MSIEYRVGVRASDPGASVRGRTASASVALLTLVLTCGAASGDGSWSDAILEESLALVLREAGDNPVESEAEVAEVPLVEGSALALARSLRVSTRRPRAAFKRSAFGSPWIDVDRNGCDTRSDILARDLGDWAEDGCKILSGSLVDPYTASPIDYTRGSSTVDIDHVVALGNGWISGAAYWSATKRAKFANVPLNLLAVSASANRAKGDSNAAQWMPPSEASRCRYIALQVAVKTRYRLSVRPEEHQVMIDTLSDCPAEIAPIEFPVPLRTVTAARTAKDLDAGETPPRFATCTAAKAAKAAPFYLGVDPEYYDFRDGDHDGIACE